MAEYEVRAENLRRVREIVDRFLRDLQGLLGNTLPEDGIDSEALSNTLTLLSSLLGGELVAEAYVKAPINLRGRQPVTDDTLQSIESKIHHLRSYLSTSSNLQYVNVTTIGLQREIRTAVERAEGRFSEFLGPTAALRLLGEMQGVGLTLSQIEKASELSRAVEKAKDAVAKAEASAETAETSASSASTAAGTAGDAALSSFYAELAASEKTSANGFRWATIAGGVVAGLTTAAFLVLPEFGVFEIEPSDYVHLLQRVIVTAAIFGLAGYFARPAHHHRSLANWAGALAVQLKTFEAYLAPIDNSAVKDDLRKSFALRAFGDHPAMKGEPSVAPSAGAMENAAAVAAKLLGK
ncbi:hypothetical protein [Arthrobacter silvisoli]|uniref:hypothetical protein n=1 Tax=Arthrobacter silvisoli TaxID=2291022 RepID=UPI00109BAF48|nr:hypothetical protein [Arthrobacter silvisoli]